MASDLNKTRSARSTALLNQYHPVAGVPDELVDSDGNVRPVWHGLLDAIGNVSVRDWEFRIARGQQYLRDAGVYHRQYNAQGTAEREWPLSAIPLLIDEVEWRSITAALSQRADILEKVVADIYGDNNLVKEGYLPSELIAQNTEWLRSMVGVKPRAGHFLNFIAFDIGRGPTGQWCVLGDRTQAPSGAGFALENRLATSQIFSGLYSPAHVHRLAGFFKDFRKALLALRGGDGSRVGILTPGPLNDTYFEHAYIARYLGFMLLEGEDMTMRDGHLMVRTVSGLQPISVLWRRMDAQWVDPLELQEDSHLGTAGLLGAIRADTLTMINALGSGILETRALLAFMPRIAREWLGTPLIMPNIATWWCGQDKERAYVKNNLSRMTIGDAYTTSLMFDASTGMPAYGQNNATLNNWIDAQAATLVGQEAVTLSTTPALDAGKIVPRPMSLRVFLARTPDGWTVMPGGFARIADHSTSTALTLQSGGMAADVWITSQHMVKPETMLKADDGPFIRRQPSALPSRAADNLYWLGRYIERTEHSVRLVRAYHVRLAETGAANSILLDYIEQELRQLGIIDLNKGLPEAIRFGIQSASTAASKITDRFSVDAKMALEDLLKTTQKMSFTAQPGTDMVQAMGVLLRKLSGFAGLVHENMTRYMGWRFLSIGRSLERAMTTSVFVKTCTAAEAPLGALDFAIEVADCAMTHRRRYEVSTNQMTVIDLLALDPLNPRSISYQINEIQEHVGFLPGAQEHEQTTAFQVNIVNVQAALAVQSPHDVQPHHLNAITHHLIGMSNDLTAQYLR